MTRPRPGLRYCWMGIVNDAVLDRVPDAADALGFARCLVQAHGTCAAQHLEVGDRVFRNIAVRSTAFD
jgi:hypothetical protein